MNERTARRLLLGAFAISILLHLVTAPFYGWRIASPVEPPESTLIAHVIVVHVAKHTPPPHTPGPTVPVPRHAQPKIAVAAPHIRPGTGPSRVVAVSSPIPTPTATPKLTPSPSPSASAGGCIKSNAPAAVSSPAPLPDVPASARRAGTNGTTEVSVDLSESGTINNASVTRTSGNSELDDLALAMAKGAQYTPNVVNCKKVAGTYIYRVRFATH